jgi:FMN phosphatase YigB (HAD superfamily)
MSLSRALDESAPKVEALLFDLGGIVFEIDFNLAIESWAARSRLTVEEVRNRWSMDGPYQKHERGEIDAAEYFDHLRTLLELEATDEEISAGWNSIFLGEITESLEDVAAARSHLPCFAFTNTNPTHHTAWMAAYPRLTAAFDRVFASSELGLRKPERAAFEAISLEIGVPLGAVLFFDDTLENVESARAAGLQTVHVQSPLDLRQALVRIGALT